MEDLHLVVPHPERAYVSDMLWLPKSKISVDVVKRNLEYYYVEKGEAVKGTLWDETGTHLIVPREYLSTQQYPAFPFPFVDLTPKKFPESKVYCSAQPRDDSEQRAYEAFKVAQGGTLNLACGKGKTVQALMKIADLGVPALIVVENTYLLKQWEEEIAEHLQFPPRQKLGMIQGKNWDWQRPVALSMLTTLSKRAADGELPEGFRDWFGVVIYDEVHHLSAPLFVQSAPVVRGQRFGLTATATRTDGMEFIYNHHIGPVFYSDLEQELIPLVFFQQTPIWVDLQTDERVHDKNGEVNISRIRSLLGILPDSLLFRYHCINEALKQGRKILCLSHSKEMLQALSEMFPGSALIIQETPMDERSNMVRKSQVAFAIMKLGREGLNDKALDTLFILTPFSNDNDAQQTMGRIQRELHGKNQPILVVLEDHKIGPMRNMCNALRKYFKGQNMTYQVLAPPNFP